MLHILPHRQLLKEFMSIGPYLREGQCEPGRYFFDCLAHCLNLNVAPELREFWGWWLVLEMREDGLTCHSEVGLYSRDGIWLSRQPVQSAALAAVEASRQHFMAELQIRLKQCALDLPAPNCQPEPSPSAA